MCANSRGGIEQEAVYDKRVHSSLHSKHKIPKELRQADFEYSEGGICMRVSVIYALVCLADWEASFAPGAADELITTAHELLKAARRSLERQSTLTEYVVLF